MQHASCSPLCRLLSGKLVCQACRMQMHGFCSLQVQFQEASKAGKSPRAPLIKSSDRVQRLVDSLFFSSFGDAFLGLASIRDLSGRLQQWCSRVSGLAIACCYDHCKMYVVLFVLWTLQVLVIRNRLRPTVDLLDPEQRLSRRMLFSTE